MIFPNRSASLGNVTSCNPANAGGAGIIDIPTTQGGAPTLVTATWDSVADGVALGVRGTPTFFVNISI